MFCDLAEISGNKTAGRILPDGNSATSRLMESLDIRTRGMLVVVHGMKASQRKIAFELTLFSIFKPTYPPCFTPSVFCKMSHMPLCFSEISAEHTGLRRDYLGFLRFRHLHVRRKITDVGHFDENPKVFTI